MKRTTYIGKTPFQNRNQELLQSLIEDVTRPAPQSAESFMTIDEARNGSTLYKKVSTRDATRILFISRDTSLLNPMHQTLDGYMRLSEVFDEVHIVVLRTGIAAKKPVLRVADNVWVYIATAAHWWWTPWAAEQIITEQLEFASGFRPDLIVARDPFECGFVAARIGKKFSRPTQLHVVEDFTDPAWLAEQAANKWRYRLMRFIVPRFMSVRTSSDQLRDVLQKKFSNIVDLATLPRFNNYQSLKEAEAVINIKDKYRQFSFIILYVGKLNHTSTLHHAIDAVRFLVQNPRVGLVVVGDGAARNSFIERTKLLGIHEQVVFERSVEDIVSYYKTADILVVTDTTEAADEIVLSAAAAGTPLLVTPTPLRTDLFEHRQSVLFASDGRVPTITNELQYFLNTPAVHMQLRTAAAKVVSERLHEDPAAYRYYYRASVEKALLLGEQASLADGDVSEESADEAVAATSDVVSRTTAE